MNMNSKIEVLQNQIAMMYLTIASMQVQIKQLDSSVQTLMSKSAPRTESESVASNLSVDGHVSDGYDSDEVYHSRAIIHTRSRNITVAKPNPYVLVKSDGNESGYEDSDDEDTQLAPFSPIRNNTRLNPFETERIENELKQRDSYLEEL